MKRYTANHVMLIFFAQNFRKLIAIRLETSDAAKPVVVVEKAGRTTSPCTTRMPVSSTAPAITGNAMRKEKMHGLCPRKAHGSSRGNRESGAGEAGNKRARLRDADQQCLNWF